VDEQEIDQAVSTPVIAAPEADDVATDVLVEEVSIDGMCGVY
jgi:mycofactocin precursor